MSITLYEAIQTIMPVKTTLKISKIDVSESLPPTILAQNNPNRLELILSNVGDYNVYINSKITYDVAEGLLLTPNGGFTALMWNEDFDIVGYSWYGLAETGAGIVVVYEVLSV